MASIYVWNGSSWILATSKVWSGSAWVPTTPYMWNGTTWNFTTPGGTTVPPYTPPLPAVTLSPTSVNPGTVGAVYSTAINAFGGTGNGYTFSVSRGSLPVGLIVSPGGVLSGTPLSAGTYDFTISATDPLGNTGSQAYTLTIAPAVVVGPTGPVTPTNNIVLNAHNVVEIDLTDFNYAEAGIMYVITTGAAFSDNTPLPAGSVVEWHSNPTIGNNGIIFTNEWNPKNDPASNYEIQATYISSTTGTTQLNASPTNQNLGTWYNMGAQGFFILYSLYAIISLSVSDEHKQMTIRIDIRRASDQVIVATNTVSLEVSVINSLSGSGSSSSGSTIPPNLGSGQVPGNSIGLS